VKDIKEFLQLSKRADAKSVKIKKPTSRNPVTKFKIRCSRFLYTLKVKDADKAEKISIALPPVLTRKEITKN